MSKRIIKIFVFILFIFLVIYVFHSISGSETFIEKFFDLLIIGLIFGLFETIFSRFVGKHINKYPFPSFLILGFLLLLFLNVYYLWKAKPPRIHEVIPLQYYINAERAALLRVPAELVNKEANYYEVLNRGILESYFQKNKHAIKDLNHTLPLVALQHFTELACILSFIKQPPTHVESIPPLNLPVCIIESRNPNLRVKDTLEDTIGLEKIKISQITGIDKNSMYKLLKDDFKLGDFEIEVPIGVEAVFERPDLENRGGPVIGWVILKNDCFKMKILCSFPYGKLMLIGPREYPPFTKLSKVGQDERWWRVPFQVVIRVSYNWLKAADPRMKYYQEWIDETKQRLIDRFYWAKLEDQKEAAELLVIRRKIEELQRANE